MTVAQLLKVAAYPPPTAAGLFRRPTAPAAAPAAPVAAAKPNAPPQFRRASIRRFLANAKQNPQTEYLSEHPVDHYRHGRRYLSGDGQTGYFMDKHGDLQNLFNNDGKGRGAEAILHAVKRGAKTLDAYDGGLPQYYSKFGFREVKRAKFDPQYAPPGWEKTHLKAKPDVVWMEYAGGDRKTLRDRVGTFDYKRSNSYV
jgi:hypothetical protein